MIYVTAVRMSPPESNQHEHITHVRWQDANDGDPNFMSKRQAVDWLNASSTNRLWVRGRPKDAEVLVVDANPSYLRTAADGFYRNNLLSLPRFLN